MQTSPLVSVVTPILNSGPTLQRTIDSVRQQTYPNIEHIVMDGGSQDNTLEILKANGSHLTWRSEPDRGQSDAINKAIAIASGEYLTWLNGDDFFFIPNAVSLSVQAFLENPNLGFVYGQLALVNYDGTLRRIDPRIHDGDYEELLHWDNNVGQPGVVFSRAAWNACGPLDVNLHYAMDWDLWIKIGAKFPFKFVPQPLAALAIYETTKTAAGGLERAEEILRLLESHGSRSPFRYYKAGLWHYEHSNFKTARKYFLIAMSRKPTAKLRRELLSLIVKTYLGVKLVNLGRAVRTQFR